MARFIDADAFIEEIQKDNSINLIADIMISRINNQPTVYDVEKVEDELEKCKTDTTQSVAGVAAAWAYQGAIDIVRKGGVE